MGKIALLVPREEMLHQAHNILQEKKYSIEEMRVIRSEAAVAEARKSIANGASIIIARGLQASLIKHHTDIPVAEIVLTAQEMALLVMRARQIVGKSMPVIAIIGFQNMFCDMSYFDELYDIRLKTYYANQGMEEDLKELVHQAAADGADLVIGGDTAISAATEIGVPSLFLSMTEESLRNAFSMAERMEYAMNVEKKSEAQIEALLDYTFSGVVRLDKNGIVMGVNPLMADMMGRKEEELKGLSIRKIAPEIGNDVLKRVLEAGKEYSLFLEMNHTSVFAVLAPITYDDHVDGAIITCHRMTGRQGGREKENIGTDKKHLPVLIQFEDILQKSDSMRECIRLARLYALSNGPIVIMGEPGTEKRMIAQGIHNSSRRTGAFLDVSCNGLSHKEQREILFSDRGAAVQAHGGTLLLQDADCLTTSNQYCLYQLIRFHVCHGQETGRMQKADVRVMVTLQKSLAQLVRQGKVQMDLYYLLSGLELRIPPLRERPEDLQEKLESSVRECCERYGRFCVLTEGARKILLDYEWRGNLFQIDSFCDRLILTADRRSIDEIAVKHLLRELYEEEENQIEKMKEDFLCEEAKRIMDVLRKYDGSRERAANELGISKATLWRHMKKYGIK